MKKLILSFVFVALAFGINAQSNVVKTNPFQDVRVRKAFYYGINEDAIVKFVMGGFAKAAGQFYPKAVFGHDPAITRPAYDPEKAVAERPPDLKVPMMPSRRVSILTARSS